MGSGEEMTWFGMGGVSYRADLIADPHADTLGGGTDHNLEA